MTASDDLYALTQDDAHKIAQYGPIRENVEASRVTVSDTWLCNAAGLLAEPDPGPTPWLIDGLIVDHAIVACVGRWKTTKSYALLDLCISVASGEPAFGKLTIPKPGPVIYICEESGRAALWRRLDALCRGRAIDPEQLRPLHVAANARVKLDDPGWQAELVTIGKQLEARLIAFDPLARMKGVSRDENAQKEMGPVIEFARILRDETRAGVAVVAHTGHNGDHMRGTSDLESVWETKLLWKREGQSPEIRIESEHREAEAGEAIRYRVSWDHDTRTMRFPLIEDDTFARVAAYLAEHPTASANAAYEEIGGRRTEVLAAVKQIRESGSHNGNHPGTTSLGTSQQGGSPGAVFDRLGTTTAQPPLELVPASQHHEEPPPLDDCDADVTYADGFVTPIEDEAA